MAIPFQDASSVELREVIKRLQEALHETQAELIEANQQLSAASWLIGALKYIADDECHYKDTPIPDSECVCTPCTAQGALYRFYSRKAFILEK